MGSTADKASGLANEAVGKDSCSVAGPTMKNATAFLLGFVAVLTPISMYVAWVTWRIAEAI